MKFEDYERIFMLSKGQRQLLGFGSTVAFVAAGFLLFFPPSRKSLERAALDQPPSRIIESAADTTSVVVALFSAGVVLLLFSVSGAKFAKLEVPGLKLETASPPIGTLDDSPSKPQTEAVAQSASTAPASADFGKPIPGVQVGKDAQDTFLLRSSWHGLKILKACQWAAQGNRLLKLREVASVGTPMAYDYAFGFLIAAFSADLVIASANPESGHVVVLRIHPTVDARINDVLDGYIGAHTAHSEALRDDLNHLLTYLKIRDKG